MHAAAWERASLLLQQGRHDLAATELRRLLGEFPDFAPAHALLALALSGQRQFDAALAEARAAVGGDPELPLAHHALAVVHWHRGEIDAAASAIGRAIALAPDDPDHRALHGQLLFARKRWPEALAAVDAGLQSDPEHVDCLNVRSMVLVRMGRAAEADDTLESALARDPDNAYTHQARGHALLHRGDARGALHHFQEALRRDPTLEGARAGLVEALKARNPVYRVLLRWMLWMERFTAGRQQQILVGSWLAVFVGRRALAADHPGAADALGLVWLGVVLFTACTVPVFNLLLLLHPVGRHALERRARNDAMLLGGAVALLAGTLVCTWLEVGAWSASGWAFALVFLLPVSGIGVFGDGWARRVMQLGCVGLLAAFVWWAWSLEVLLDELAVGAPRRSVDTRVRSADAPRLDAHLDVLGHLVLAAALSSWFVLLAPKGRRR